MPANWDFIRMLTSARPGSSGRWVLWHSPQALPQMGRGVGCAEQHGHHRDERHRRQSKHLPKVRLGAGVYSLDCRRDPAGVGKRKFPARAGIGDRALGFAQ